VRAHPDLLSLSSSLLSSSTHDIALLNVGALLQQQLDDGEVA